MSKMEAWGGSPSRSQSERASPSTHRKKMWPAPPSPLIRRKSSLTKRNTCGSLYVDSTLGDPDDEALIYAASQSLLNRIKLKSPPNKAPGMLAFDEYISEIPERKQLQQPFSFQSKASENELHCKRDRLMSPLSCCYRSQAVHAPDCDDDDSDDDCVIPIVRVPTLDDIKDFIEMLFTKGEMLSECIVTGIIYIERLLDVYSTQLFFTSKNWRPIVFISLVLASKICDDNSPINSEWSHLCPQFSPVRINDLEVALLHAFKFDVSVSASMYADHYFRLRSLASKLEMINTGAMMKPVDIAVAQRIASASKQFGREKSEESGDIRQQGISRSSTVPMQVLLRGVTKSRIKLKYKVTPNRPTAGIEHMVTAMSPTKQRRQSMF